MRTLQVLAILLTCLFCACGGSNQAPQPQTQAIENDYLRLLEDLTVLMDAPDKEPTQILENIRNYVNASKAAASGTLNKLNQGVLDMTEEERKIWRAQAKPRTEAALEQFSNAQMQLQKRLNDAQKWELGEILALLR